MNNRHAISNALRPVLHSFILFAVICITFLVLVSTLVVIQGQRDEVRSAGAAVVVLPAQDQSRSQDAVGARLDHSIDLYRRGYVNRIIVAEQENQTGSEVAAYVAERRLPPEALLLVSQGDTAVEQLRSAGEVMRLNGIETVLVSSERHEMLRMLKMARDVGMDAYGVPIRQAEIPLVEYVPRVVGEAWAYIVYIFFG